MVVGGGSMQDSSCCRCSSYILLQSCDVIGFHSHGEKRCLFIIINEVVVVVVVATNAAVG